MLLHVPLDFPHQRVLISLFPDGEKASNTFMLKCGQSLTIRQTLPCDSGYLECWVEPTFQPRTHGINEDERVLGCLCQTCRIVSPGGAHDLLVSLM